MAMPRASRTIARRLVRGPFCTKRRSGTAPTGAFCSKRLVWRELFRGHVRGREAAVDQEGRAVDVARVVAGEKQRRVGDLTRLGRTSHRQMLAPALISARR